MLSFNSYKISFFILFFSLFHSSAALSLDNQAISFITFMKSIPSATPLQEQKHLEDYYLASPKNMLENLAPKQGGSIDHHEQSHTVKLQTHLAKEIFEKEPLHKGILKCRYKGEQNFDIAGTTEELSSYFPLEGRWGVDDKNQEFFALREHYLNVLNSCVISLKHRYHELKNRKIDIANIQTFAAENILGRAAPLLFYYKKDNGYVLMAKPIAESLRENEKEG